MNKTLRTTSPLANLLFLIPFILLSGCLGIENDKK